MVGKQIQMALCQLQIWSKWKFRLIENIFYRRIAAGKDNEHENFNSEFV